MLKGGNKFQGSRQSDVGSCKSCLPWTKYQEEHLHRTDIKSIERFPNTHGISQGFLCSNSLMQKGVSHSLKPSRERVDLHMLKTTVAPLMQYQKPTSNICAKGFSQLSWSRPQSSPNPLLQSHAKSFEESSHVDHPIPYLKAANISFSQPDHPFISMARFRIPTILRVNISVSSKSCA